MSPCPETPAFEARVRRLIDAILIGTPVAAFDRNVAYEQASDVLEELLGLPDFDGLANQPVTIWGRLRDLATRVERLEGLGAAGADVVEDPPTTDVFGNVLRPGIRVAFPDCNGELEVGTVDAVGGGSVFIVGASSVDGTLVLRGRAVVVEP